MPNGQTADPPVLGRDLLVTYRVSDGRYEDLDLATSSSPVRGQTVSDLMSVAAVDNAVQAVVHRIKTVRGELADLGHPEYGSRHHELIGQPNTERNRNLVKLYLLQALALEPRIEKVLKARVVPDPQRDRVTIELTIRFIGSPVPQDLVVPFSFGGPA
jgi:phage baseplate assembly protein W